MKSIYPEEKGKITINGHLMEWVLRRSKAESCFGIRGSRIFELFMKKDGVTTLEYGRGYSIKPNNEDEETALCFSYLIDRYGKVKKKEKKNA